MRPIALLSLLSLVACVGPNRVARAVSHVDLGTAYFKEGNTEGAIETLRRAAELDPRNWRAANALAVVYVAKGQPELAEGQFRRALRINPGEAEILVNYGAFLVRTGRLDDGIAAFGESLHDLDYRNPAIVESNLAYALLQAGRADEALPHAREAIRRAPTMCEAYYHLGLIQESRKDTLAALEAYKQLVQACPRESLGGRLRAGCIEVGVGLSDEGSAALREVIAAAPGTPFADEARTCLLTLAP